MVGLQGLVHLAATNNLEGARTFAAANGGYLLEDAREPWEHLPFRGLLVVATDEIEAVAELADVGHYLGAERLIKEGPMEVAGLFPMVHRSDRTRAEADGHWRDVHAPLALEHHRAMSHYTQLAVLHRISGAEFNGFAVCAFMSEDDLRERFYSLPDSVEVIARDIRNFADTRRSPRRLVVRRA